MDVVELPPRRGDPAGEVPAPFPRLADWEKPIFDQVAGNGPIVSPLPIRVDRELDDGDVLHFGGDVVRVVSATGHTPGSVA
jgi:glyoxylase-like metal-dependent hydrolase (beta-lactamase superfamily II)